MKYTRGEELVTIGVYYRSDRGTVRIVKGKNDEDPRWRKFLHSSKHSVGERLTIEEKTSFYPVDLKRRETPKKVSHRGLYEGESSTLNGEDIVVLAIIGSASAYILCTFCRIML